MLKVIPLNTICFASVGGPVPFILVDLAYTYSTTFLLWQIMCNISSYWEPSVTHCPFFQCWNIMLALLRGWEVCGGVSQHRIQVCIQQEKLLSCQFWTASKYINQQQRVKNGCKWHLHLGTSVLFNHAMKNKKHLSVNMYKMKYSFCIPFFLLKYLPIAILQCSSDFCEVFFMANTQTNTIRTVL